MRKLKSLETKQIDGSHYKDMAIQPMEYNLANKMDILEASAIRYISRHHVKNGKKDLEKAIHMLEICIEWKYPDDGS